MDVDSANTSTVDNSQSNVKEESQPDWRRALPSNAGEVRDLSDQAFWTLSSCKTDGFGIQQLLENNIEQYWQSDGPQPHTVTVEFGRKTNISFLLLYLDYKTDESYTPSKVVVHLGSSILDLDDGLAVMFSEPVGWQVISFVVKLLMIVQVIDLRKSNGRASRAFVLQLQVVQNHQNGRDTHIRQMRVLGSAGTRYDTDLKFLNAAGANIENMPSKFTSNAIATFSKLR
ncbi:hypothetical protein AB6A40_006074 [Gnathostoma spinigerum]|uniref:Anaphase-promoting complex subunit 10 n=1 Tax=Gnathostoma spinigerum TaxID=75299 RepID=A0ABD6ESY8_9BILA